MSMFGNAMTVASVISFIFLVLMFVVPLLIIWLLIRYFTNKTNKRAEIVTLLVEKNPDVDIEEILKKISPKKRLLKEKLLTKLLCGCIFSLIGFMIGFIIFGCGLWINWCGGSDPGEIDFLYFCGGVLFAIGIGFLIYYFVGKKLLAKELEAEEKKLAAEANS